MRFDILTVLPDLLQSPFQHSILKRAQAKGLIEIHIHNIRDFSQSKHKQVDDYQFGGGAGMVMMIEPIAACIQHLKAQRNYDEIIYLTPDGDLFEQQTANKLSLLNNVILLCGHYKGVDQRVRDLFVTKEISIGSYVLSGGELAAAIIVDAVGRIIPGAINDETSALTDSFQDNLLAPPVYTRPADYMGLKVPEILLSGNEAAIIKWRENKALEITKNKRPDLLSDD